jgi:hypothetical protein
MYIRVEFDDNPNVRESLDDMQSLSDKFCIGVTGRLNDVSLYTWPDNECLLAQYNMAARSKVIALERVL